MIELLLLSDARTDGLSHRRSSQDISNSEQESEKGSSRLKPTLSALPMPSLLVGYASQLVHNNSFLMDNQ
jgi:hypothetical protein